MLKLKKIKPLYNGIVTTMDAYEKDVFQNGILVVQKGALKEFQTVISIGDSVRNIKEGDVVKINPMRYAIKKYEDGSLKDGVIEENPVVKYNFNIVEINDKGCLLLMDRDIDYVVEEYEEVEDKDPVILMPSIQV